MMSKFGKNHAIIAASILGVLVSTYALFVEMKAESNPGYKALCDINDMVSCTKVLTSKYSKGFGIINISIPNPIFGILYYCIMVLLTIFEQLIMARFQFLLSLLALASSFYLAGVLIFVLQDVCLICITTYFINGLLVYLAYGKMKAIALKNK